MGCHIPSQPHPHPTTSLPQPCAGLHSPPFKPSRTAPSCPNPPGTSEQPRGSGTQPAGARGGDARRRRCPEAASTAFGALPGAGPVRVPLTSQCGRALVREAGGGRRAGDSWLPNGGRLLPAAAGPAAAPGTWAAGRGARSRGWPYRPAAARIAGKRNGAAVEVEVVGFPACSSSVCWWMKGTCCPERCG